MALIDRIHECRRWTRARFAPLVVAGARTGWIRDDHVAHLAARPDLFDVDADAVRVSERLATPRARTDALAAFFEDLAASGHVPELTEERYAVAPRRDAATLFEVDRAALPFLGARAYGVHLNGFVRRADGLHLWVATRSSDKTTFPGQLDNLVAGGQPAGLGVRENLAKECAEEADIGPALAARAVPVGAVSYRVDAPGGMRDDTLFLFDLELPDDFVPRNTDGEVARFDLQPVGAVAEVVATSRAYKFNCNLVVIDFLVRHGVLDPDEPGYTALVDALRGG